MHEGRWENREIFSRSKELADLSMCINVHNGTRLEKKYWRKGSTKRDEGGLVAKGLNDK